MSSLEACFDKSTLIQFQNYELPANHNLSPYGCSPYDTPNPQDYETECQCITKAKPCSVPSPIHVPIHVTCCVPSQQASTNCVPNTQCPSLSNYAPTLQSTPSCVPPSLLPNIVPGLSNIVPILYPENILCSMDTAFSGHLNCKNIRGFETDLAIYAPQNSYANLNNQYGNVYTAYC